MPVVSAFADTPVNMAGLYLHIPFCKSRCIYCGFYSTTALSLRQRYVDALCGEMALRRDSWRPIFTDGPDTIYFGGGTPSMLTMPQLQQLFEAVARHFYPDGQAITAREVTMECNPDDVSHEFVAQLCQLPVNRVSMGVQTFSDELLRFLGRRHTARQAVEAVSLLRQGGIANISIDLMYGLPGTSLDGFRHDIDQALAIAPDHLSAYCLSYEPSTPLHRMLDQGRVEEVDEELERAMYYELVDRLTANGYEHYEISNFARPGYRSLHNSSYWADVPYLGIGAAAHSYDQRSRQWNTDDMDCYIQAIASGHTCEESEQMDQDTRYNDRLTTALRTREGLSLDCLTTAQRHYCLCQAKKLIDGGLLINEADRLRLSRSGLFVSDMVISSLMLV